MGAREELIAVFEFEDWEDGPALLDRYRAEVLREAAALVEFCHGQAPDVFSPLDSAALLRHVAGGGDPNFTVYS